MPESCCIGRPATPQTRQLMKNTTRLMGVARLCRAAHPQMRLSQLLTLLAVAEHPGRTQTELALEVGLTLGAVSRAVDVMGTAGRRDKKGAPPLGWIEAVTDPDDDRNLRVHLLPAGRRLVQAISKELEM